MWILVVLLMVLSEAIKLLQNIVLAEKSGTI